MAIKTIYTVQKNGINEEYVEAYLRIQKINTTASEYEHLKNVEDPNKPDIAQEVEWVKRVETSVTVFVWPDELARKNRAQVIDWFTFEFEYDLNGSGNIFQQAYNALHKIFNTGEDIV